MSTRKVVAIGLVVLLHALLGYAFITGLAMNVVKQIAQDTKVFDVVEEPPPPPEEPPPPPPDVPVEPPPAFTPPPVVRIPQPTPPPQIVVVDRPPPITAPQAPVIAVAPPAPPAKPSVAARATARGNPGSWVTQEDYPSRALREERQGVTAISYDVDPAGRAVNCQVTASSGSPDLDDATCKNFTRRARYKPAQDADGNPITQPGLTQRIRWEIPRN